MPTSKLRKHRDASVLPNSIARQLGRRVDTLLAWTGPWLSAGHRGKKQSTAILTNHRRRARVASYASSQCYHARRVFQILGPLRSRNPQALAKHPLSREARLKAARQGLDQFHRLPARWLPFLSKSGRQYTSEMAWGATTERLLYSTHSNLFIVLPLRCILALAVKHVCTLLSVMCV